MKSVAQKNATPAILLEDNSSQAMRIEVVGTSHPLTMLCDNALSRLLAGLGRLIHVRQPTVNTLAGLLFAGFAALDIWAYRRFDDSNVARGYGRVLFWWSSYPQAWLLASAIAFSLISVGAFVGLIL